jgi:hypothetical protein
MPDHLIAVASPVDVIPGTNRDSMLPLPQIFEVDDAKPAQGAVESDARADLAINGDERFTAPGVRPEL